MLSIKIASCFAYYLTPLCLLLAGRPGPVTVTVTTESGECLGETVFTYIDPEKNKRKQNELRALVKDFAKKLKQYQQGDDDEESRKSVKIGNQQGN